MSSADLPDSVARNIAEWTGSNEQYTDRSAREAWARDDDRLGRLRRPRSDRRRARQGCRARRGRARLRYRLHLGAARQAGRTAGRRRSDPGAARDRQAAHAGDGHRVPARRSARRGRAASRRLLRPRRLGVRRLPLGGARALDRRGGAAAPSRRATRVPDELGAALPLRSRRRHRRGDAPPVPVRHVPDDVARADRAWSTTSTTAAGSPSSASTDSRSRRSTSCRRRREHVDHEYYDHVTVDWAQPLAVRRPLGRAQARVSVPPAPPLLLASTSPQRPAILRQLGIPFDAVAPEYHEEDPPDADPRELVLAHARGKARSVARLAADRPVLGVDTTVCLDGRLYGKAATAEQAAEMLEQLGGRTHLVISGLCLLTPGWEEAAARGDGRHLPAAHAARPGDLRGQR